jgi:DNA-3-methyladenine glycosylase
LKKDNNPLINIFPPQNAQKLCRSFYLGGDVVTTAKTLLGKILVTNFNGVTTAGRMVETEAYNGIIDKASHAWNGRRTKRTEIMYRLGGTAYVYLVYGIHQLFNIVTNAEDVPHAVLVRAVEPVWGVSDMLARTGKQKADYTLTRGPGNVSKALGISIPHTGLDMEGDEIFLLDDGTTYKEEEIIATPRIGVDYAGEDALLRYRFYVKGNKYVSGKGNI